MKKRVLTLLLIFALLLSAKIVLSLYINGLILYPDESCFLLRAKHFAASGDFISCRKLTQFPNGTPLFLYSFVISPVFLFFKNLQAFHAALILNAFLSSTLIFPLFSIFKKHLKKDFSAYLYAILILLIPTITGFERMIMSETLFITLSIWSLFFYIKSFKQKGHKISALILALLATLARPFGFILFLAIGVNELITNKHKKTILIILGLTIVATVILLPTFIPNISSNISEKLSSLTVPRNYILILKALKNQANSLILATFLAPLVIFLSSLFQEKSSEIKNIRYFLLSFIILNFLVSAQHIYQYFINGLELDLLTRYLNVSIVFILIYGFIFLEKTKKIIINPLLFAFIVLPLLLLTFDAVNHALIITLSPYYQMLEGFVPHDLFFKLIFLPISFALVVILVFQQQKILKYAVITLLILQSIALAAWQIKYTHKIEYSAPVFQEFKDSEYKILFLESAAQYQGQMAKLNYNYFRLLTLTSNNVSTLGFYDLDGQRPDINSNKWKEMVADNDYLITPYTLELPIVLTTRRNEYLYKLK